LALSNTNKDDDDDDNARYFSLYNNIAAQTLLSAHHFDYIGRAKKYAFNIPVSASVL